MTTKPKTNSDANGNAPKRKSRAKQEPKTSPTDAVSVDPVSIGSQDTETTETDAGNNDGKPSSTPPTANQPNEQDKGNDTFVVAESATDCASGDQRNGLIAHARHGETRGMCWERLRKEARAAGLPRGQGPGTAYEWATRETDRLFPAPLPPEPPPPPEPEPVIPDDPPPEPEEPEAIPEPEAIIAADKPAADSLVFAVPESWGELPDNATLQAEIAWVSANRLRVRDGSGVDLSRAKTPAPSYSALSWLETSILFPSKFADISVKATANQDDEKELIRREKMSIEEIRSILAEMLED